MSLQDADGFEPVNCGSPTVQRRTLVTDGKMMKSNLSVQPDWARVMVHDRITTDPKIMFGKPVIRGTRITVELILRKIAAGMSEQQIIEHHPHLTAEDIRAAAEYAANHLAGEEVVLASGSVK